MVLVILRICIDDGQPKDYQYKEPNRKNDPKKKKKRWIVAIKRHSDVECCDDTSSI